MYVMLVKLQSIQNEDMDNNNNKKNVGRFHRSVLRCNVHPFRNVTLYCPTPYCPTPYCPVPQTHDRSNLDVSSCAVDI